jgi:uncharacterized membrane protein YgcG
MPDSVFKGHLAPKCDPIAKVTIFGCVVPSMAIEAVMARICPLNTLWRWEAISHDSNSFLVNFPMFQDLERVNGIQMGVPDFDAQFKITKWEVKDIQPKFVLPQLWVHVEGVLHTLRHFHGLWALGSLMGTTVDVDLPTLYSQNVVWILVAMMNLDTLNKHQDDKGPYVDVTVTLKLKGYDFRFRKQKTDFKPDTKYTPFFWKRKDDDLDDRDMRNSKGKGPHGMPQGASSSQSSSMATSMDVDGSGGVSGGGGSGVCSQQRSGATGAAASLDRPMAAALRGRPNMMGCTRPGAAARSSLTGLRGAVSCDDRPGVQEVRPLAQLGVHDDLGHPGVVGVRPLDVLGQVSAEPPPLVATQVQSQTVVEPPSHAGLGGGLLDTTVDGQDSPASAAGDMGVSSPAITPVSPVTLEVTTLASKPALYVSTPPSSLTVPTFKADFVTPTRRSGRYGAAVDGASASDEDSLQRAMRRKAELNLDYSGIISPSKSKSFLSFSTPMISSKLASVGINIDSNDKEFFFLLMP